MAVKKRTKKSTTNSALKTENSVNSTSSRRKSFIIPIAVVIIAGLLYYFRGVFVVATVNGEPIDRLTFTHEMEKQSGKQTLQSLITKKLILQEARKQNVSVSSDEINAEIKKIETSLTQRGQQLDQVLKIQGITRNDLIEQIKIQKMVQKMLAKEIRVSDAEVNDYIEKNKDSIPAGTDANAIKQSARDQLEQQKLSEKFQTWLDSIQKKTSVNYFVGF